MKVTKINKAGIDLIHFYESCKLSAYPDPATGGKPITIGWGTTIYPDGTKVKLGDAITMQQADEYFAHDISKFEKTVDALCRDDLNDNQFSALVSFAYNCGENNLRISSLRKRVNQNPNERHIFYEFQKWVYANGKKMNGLVKRRLKEAELYFKPI